MLSFMYERMEGNGRKYLSAHLCKRDPGRDKAVTSELAYYLVVGGIGRKKGGTGTGSKDEGSDISLNMPFYITWTLRTTVKFHGNTYFLDTEN